MVEHLPGMQMVSDSLAFPVRLGSKPKDLYLGLPALGWKIARDFGGGTWGGENLSKAQCHRVNLQCSHFLQVN